VCQCVCGKEFEAASSVLQAGWHESCQCEEAKGEWQDNDWLMWERDNRELYISIRLLRQQRYASVVDPSNWSKWIEGKSRCPHLARSDNDGFVKSLLVKGRQGQLTRVWLRSQVKSIIARLTNVKAQRVDPDFRGEWDSGIYHLTADVPEVALKAGDVLWPDNRIAEEAGVCARSVGGWRHHRQRALDPVVNGGRLRGIPVAKPVGMAKGRTTIYVSSKDDAKKIIAWRDERKGKSSSGRRGKTLEQIAGRLRVPWPKMLTPLRFAAKQFRSDRPESAWPTSRWNGKHNHARDRWEYDDEKFVEWLDGRPLQSFAAAASRVETPRDVECRKRGELFLLFVLTRGDYRRQSHAFSNFMATVRVGQTIKPCDRRVAVADIRRWAEEAGIRTRHLDAARAKLPVVAERIGRRGSCWKWRLAEEVTLAAPVVTGRGCTATVRNDQGGLDARQCRAPSGKYTGHVKKAYRTGRKADQQTELMLEFCFDHYVLHGWTRSRVLDRAKRQFGDDAPNTEADVAINARRWAARFEPALPLDRDGEGVAKLRSAALKSQQKTPEK
jgi:hypothetical protein